MLFGQESMIFSTSVLMCLDGVNLKNAFVYKKSVHFTALFVYVYLYIVTYKDLRMHGASSYETPSLDAPTISRCLQILILYWMTTSRQRSERRLGSPGPYPRPYPRPYLHAAVCMCMCVHACLCVCVLVCMPM